MVKEKENRLPKFSAFVLLITILMLTFISGTFSRYTTNVEKEDSAVVAKWDVSIGNASESFELFNKSAIYDTNGVTDFTQAGTVDADVKKGENVAIIAPGTWGKLAIELNNNSDVTAEYDLDYDINNTGVPFEWSTDGLTWNEDLSAIASAKTGTIEIGTTETLTIYWRWNIGNTEDDNTLDTSLGTSAETINPTISISCTFTQVD